MLPGVDAAVEEALTAAARGLALFPLPPGGRLPAPGWHRQCTTDPTQVARMAAAGNLGVGCRASGVFALDLDVHPATDGTASFAAACSAANEAWPDTFTVRTPTGGRHLYFRVPPGRIIASTSAGRTPLGPGIDTRGPGRRTGGYLLAPGSTIHGRPYRIEHDTTIADPPGWLARLLMSP